jgi:hypothetical protein
MWSHMPTSARHLAINHGQFDDLAVGDYDAHSLPKSQTAAVEPL